jgi:RNA polymerase sigma-70 factor (ECF subfamily)
MQFTIGRSKKQKKQKNMNGSQEVFLEAYDEYAKKIYSFVYYRVSSVEDAQDITSHAFLKAWEYMANDDGPAIKKIGPFLYTIARNLVIDHYRTRKRTVDIDDMTNDISLSELPDIERLDLAHDTKRVMYAMELLNEEEKEVLRLRYISEYSIDEIAGVLKKKKNHIYVLIFRATKKLKKILNT